MNGEKIHSETSAKKIMWTRRTSHVWVKVFLLIRPHHQQSTKVMMLLILSTSIFIFLPSPSIQIDFECGGGNGSGIILQFFDIYLKKRRFLKYSWAYVKRFSWGRKNKNHKFESLLEKLFSDGASYNLL